MKYLKLLLQFINSKEFIHDPAVVKTLINRDHRAIYFSRAAIPYIRDEKKKIGTNIFIIGVTSGFMAIEQIYYLIGKISYF